MGELLTKCCTKCGEEKELGEFHSAVLGKYGRAAQCKTCVNLRNASRRAKEAAAIEYRDGCLNPHNCQAKKTNLCIPCAVAKREANPEAVNNRNSAASRTCKSLWNDEEYRARAVERARIRFQQMNETDEFKETISQNGKRSVDRLRDPEVQERRISGIKDHWEYYHFEKRMEQEAAEWEASNQHDE